MTVPLAMVMSVAMIRGMAFARGMEVRVHYRQVHSTRMLFPVHVPLSTCYWKLDNKGLRIR